MIGPEIRTVELAAQVGSPALPRHSRSGLLESEEGPLELLEWVSERAPLHESQIVVQGVEMEILLAIFHRSPRPFDPHHLRPTPPHPVTRR